MSRYLTGDRYVGSFKNGKKNGTGKIIYSDNSYYDGNLSLIHI